jgi:hypothetical protein
MGKFPLIECWELFIGFMSICEEKICGRGFNIRGEEGDGRRSRRWRRKKKSLRGCFLFSEEYAASIFQE